jgi:hypothetical protein
VVQVLPFKEATEMIGATAGRTSLREQHTLSIVTTSDHGRRGLAHALLAALGDRPALGKTQKKDEP